jgi:cytochrome oxidase Cu insertion factor (SCO1/SenC/PrrC family)
MGKNLISAAILVCLLTFAGIAQRAKTEALKVGETAPDFSLVSDAGTTVNLSTYKEPVVLVFYRAYW